MIDLVDNKATLNAIYSFLLGNKTLTDSDWGDNISEALKTKIVTGL